MNLNRDIFGQRPRFAVLIDPDFDTDPRFDRLLSQLSLGMSDIILIGGSSAHKDNVERVVKKIKEVCDQPIILFPGNAFHLSTNADALFLPSLISGRNADYLIGKHVESARMIYDSGIPVFSMGYIMVDGGSISTASYITQTLPIPANQIGLAVQTALAGQLLGLRLLYLEAGSGANYPVTTEMIEAVKNATNIPLVVGGGITDERDIVSVLDAGADMIVLGTIFEKYPDELSPLYEAFMSHVVL